MRLNIRLALFIRRRTYAYGSRSRPYSGKYSFPKKRKMNNVIWIIFQVEIVYHKITAFYQTKGGSLMNINVETFKDIWMVG